MKPEQALPDLCFLSNLSAATYLVFTTVYLEDGCLDIAV
jgi:hypothetical protein